MTQYILLQNYLDQTKFLQVLIGSTGTYKGT